MIASSIAMIVLFGIAELDQVRTQTGLDYRRRSGVLEMDYGRASRAVWHFSQRIEDSDRIRIGNDGANQWLQVRRPTMTTAGCTGTSPAPTCFDDQRNYVWEQYRLDAGGRALRYRTNMQAPGNCGNSTLLAGEITRLSFTYPAGGDENLVAYRVVWDGGAGFTHEFAGNVATRSSSANTAVGLDAANLGAPPAPCAP